MSAFFNLLGVICQKRDKIIASNNYDFIHDIDAIKLQYSLPKIEVQYREFIFKQNIDEPTGPTLSHSLVNTALIWRSLNKTAPLQDEKDGVKLTHSLSRIDLTPFIPYVFKENQEEKNSVTLSHSLESIALVPITKKIRYEYVDVEISHSLVSITLKKEY